MTRAARWQLVALLAILTLAVALRFYRLGAQSLWNDEGTSVALALRPLATITRQAASDIHPPLYYYLLHGWVRLWGTGEAAVRSLSALAGALVTLCTYALARRAWPNARSGRAVALLAALFSALSPFQVYYAQEARMYMLVTLLGLLSMLAFLEWLRAVERPGSRLGWLAFAYGLASIAAIYTHYFAFTLLLAQNVAFVIWLALGPREPRPWSALWRRAWPWAVMQLVVGLAYVPWLALSWGSLTAWPAVTEPMSLGALLARLARVFALGATLPERGRTLLAGLAVSALILPGLAWWPRRETPARKAEGLSLALMAAYLLVPIVSMYLLSLSRPMYKDKFLLLATPPYTILLARGVVAAHALARRLLRAAWPGVALALVLALTICGAAGASLWRLYTDETTFRDDYRGIVAYINASAGPHDAILINAPSQIETVNYYYRGPWPEYPLPLQRPLDAAQTQRELERIVAQHERLYAIFWATAESDPQGMIEGWLDQHCYKALDRWFGNLRLVVYAVPKAAASAIAQPLDVTFGDRILLRGYTLLTPQPSSGDILQLTLFWQASEAVPERYKVFVHLVDARGNIVGQRDSEPGGGGLPTTSWEPGALIADNYGLLLPPGSPPGDHHLRVGLYRLEDGTRLPLRGAQGERDDALELAPVSVSLPDAPPPLAALDWQVRHDATWNGVRLVGHSLARLGHEHEAELTLRPGDMARLILYWSREPAGEAGEDLTLVLRDRTGNTVWQHPLRITDGAFAPSAWREGERVRDIHRVQLPGNLAPGAYTLLLVPGNWASAGEETLRRLTLNAP
jgi:4-amino-4-deoxy-L-arabinose transferase-like glycosyltransferase